MRYLLDTNTCIRYLNGRSERLKERFQGISSEEIKEVAVCSVVKAEMFYGAAKSQNPERTLEHQLTFLNQFVSLPFDDQAASVYGTIRAKLEKSGTPIGPNDLLIASIAVANNLVLVTHNVSEFSRVEGLQIEDWEQPHVS